MATETNLGTIHVFPNITSYNTNKTSVGTNDLAVIPTFGGSVVEHYVNGTNWYRVWDNGWLEQGGVSTTAQTVTFLKPFRDNQYTLVIGNTNGDDDGWLAQKATGKGSYFNVVQTKIVNWRGWVAFGWKDSDTSDKDTYTIKGNTTKEMDYETQFEVSTWRSDTVLPPKLKGFTISGIEVWASAGQVGNGIRVNLTGSGTRPSKLYVYINNNWLTLTPQSGTWYFLNNKVINFPPNNTFTTVKIRDTAPT